MSFEYKIKGIMLDIVDMVKISQYYEAACTAEIVLEKFPVIKNEDEALQIGYKVREMMDDWGYSDGQSEIDAIEEILKEKEFIKESRGETNDC